MLKTRKMAWNQVFCVKNVDFSRNHKVFWGQKLGTKWIEIVLKYCTFSLMSSQEQKRSNIQYKIWNCPPHLLFKSTVPPPPLWKMLKKTAQFVSYCIPFEKHAFLHWTLRIRPVSILVGSYHIILISSYSPNWVSNTPTVARGYNRSLILIPLFIYWHMKSLVGI